MSNQPTEGQLEEDEAPYICSCGFCGDGLLRFWHSEKKEKTVALCDECELFWDDVEAVFENADIPSTGDYSQLDVDKDGWKACTVAEIQEREMESWIGGFSE